MKFLKRFKFREIFVISAIVIGVGGLLFTLISTWMIDEPEPEMETSEQKPAVLEVPGQSTVQSPKSPSEADIEAAITALENLDVTENRDESVESAGDEVSPEIQVTDSSDQTPLSYEEELKQRYRRIRKTPEYQELNAKVYAVQLELEAWGNLETPAEDAWVKFLKNRYSVLGLTEAEAEEIELSDEQHEFMAKEGKRLEQEAIIEGDQRAALYRENRRERAELDRQILELLGMTEEEVLMILGRR